MKITLLVDDRKTPGFRAEFGLAMLLNYRNCPYLFDTGAGAALVPNLRQAGIAPESIARVILSHGHRDHTGGLCRLSPEKIYACQGVAMPHYSRHDDGEVHCLTMPEAAKKVLSHTVFHPVSAFQEIAKGVFLTGPIPRVTAEDCGGNFFHDKTCTMPDNIPEETALLTAGGVLVTGCCHAGILNTLFFCQKIHPEIKIRTIVGGLHLRCADAARLALTAAFLKRIRIRRLALLHCTGEAAIAYLKNALPDCRFDELALGETKDF
ncbi:MAG: MBL fold metallo-hydrolase [Victivallaceae bacterium]|nr:MBL fold metallo-hydrolase [Victivallaceae bacterium]